MQIVYMNLHFLSMKCLAFSREPLFFLVHFSKLARRITFSCNFTFQACSFVLY